MRFTPVTEEQAATVNLFPKGEYDAVVKSAVEKTSKSNNPMFEIDLTVYGPEGKQRVVRDWLVCTDGGQAKLQHFCKSSGQWDAYQAGELSAHAFVDSSVRVKLGIDEGTGEFAPKNKVVDYLSAKVTTADKLQGVPDAKRKAAAKAMPDDDIPF